MGDLQVLPCVFICAWDVMEKKKKRKHCKGNWLMFRNHSSSCVSAAVWKTCFAFYGTCHKASNTVRCLSMSSELKKKKKKAALPPLKNVFITDGFALEVPGRWLPVGTDLTHWNPHLQQRVGGCFGGRKMLMELDPEPHRGAAILSTPCTSTNLFLLCCPSTGEQFF